MELGIHFIIILECNLKLVHPHGDAARRDKVPNLHLSLRLFEPGTRLKSLKQLHGASNADTTTGDAPVRSSSLVV